MERHHMSYGVEEFNYCSISIFLEVNTTSKEMKEILESLIEE